MENKAFSEDLPGCLGPEEIARLEGFLRRMNISYEITVVPSESKPQIDPILITKERTIRTLVVYLPNLTSPERIYATAIAIGIITGTLAGVVTSANCIQEIRDKTQKS